MRYPVVLFAFLILTSCAKNTNVDVSAIHFIPEGTAVIIKVNDFETTQTAISKFDLPDRFSATAAYEYISNNGLNNFTDNFTADVIICVVPLGKREYELLSFGEVGSQVDSLHVSQTASKTYLDHTIITYSESERQFHTVKIGSKRFVSSSQLLLENCIRNQDNHELSPETKTLSKTWATADSRAQVNVFLRGSGINALGRKLIPEAWNSPLPANFEWAALDLDLNANGLLAAGVSTLRDHTSAMHILSKTDPVRLTTSTLIPPNAKSAIILGFQEWSNYTQGLVEHRQILTKDLSINSGQLLKNVQEVACISLAAEKILVLKPLDEEIIQDALPQEPAIATFRETEIFKFSDSLFARQAFKELFDPPVLNYYARLDGFVIFGKEQNEIKSLITSVRNKSNLGNDSRFKVFSESLSSRSSYLYIALNENLKKSALAANPALQLNTISTDDYPFTALQLINDDGFFHTNLLIKRISVEESTASVTQMASAPLDSDLQSRPQLVKNHLTNGFDILVQDVANKLYLINNSGDILWEKELPNPMLGAAQQVDLYRNGRLQLAFVTKEKLYVLDRNGNDVAPFPLDPGKTITQPLAVFDYDNSRNYRLVTIHGSEVQMREGKGKIVSGFNFNKAGSPIVFPAKHIRMGKKDYILIAEADGSLNILNRVGKARIPIDQKFKWGESGIFDRKGNFVFYTEDGTRVSISQSGRITKPKQLDGLVKYDIGAATEAILNDNELRINNQLIDLDFGLYAKPKIEELGKKIIVTLYDEQSHLVYAFDDTGKSLPNFPVYGSSTAAFGLLDGKKQQGFVTQGETNTVLIYHITK
ncbi:MAG: hypothetical protein WBG71_12560 [Leeuwenhoekiella sp.]